MQTAVRMPESWIPRLEAIGEKLGETGLEVSQAAVIRLALARGIASLEGEHGLKQPSSSEGAEKGEPRPASKPAKRPK